ncbi:hypothetical protein [Modicisalibacter coralii]|uniref:hypothetical protein n=1 Tax=Modicisalibacter coralii TaxID=2304602 RepID=UPI00100BD219|nr:hypothetical protein [Halomonas coralii]
MDDLILTIYRRSKDLLTEIRRSHSNMDHLDFMANMQDMVKRMATGQIDPKKDWEEELRASQKQETLDQLVDKYYDAALCQAVYVSILYERDIDLIESNDSGRVKEEKIKEKGREMLTALEWANRYWSAFHILTQVRDKDYSQRSKKAHEAKRAKEDEVSILLRSLVRSKLKKRPPNGWPEPVETATTIADDLIPLIQDQDFPLPTDRDKLMDKIHQLILKNEHVLKDFQDNANKKVKFAKITKMNVTFDQ